MELQLIIRDCDSYIEYSLHDTLDRTIVWKCKLTDSTKLEKLILSICSSNGLAMLNNQNDDYKIKQLANIKLEYGKIIHTYYEDNLNYGNKYRINNNTRF